MLELKNLRQQLGPKFASSFQQSINEFSLENGQAQLKPWFNQIKLHHYENRLYVTDVDPLLEYVLSSSQARSEIAPEKMQSAWQTVHNHIKEHGSYKITTDSGMFVAINGCKS